MLIQSMPYPAAPAGVSATSWRILFQDVEQSGRYVIVRDIQMFGAPGGPDLTSGGAAAASVNNAQAGIAFDNDSATVFNMIADPMPKWISYTKAAPFQVNQISIQCDSLTHAPRAFSVQYLSGGIWVTHWSVVAAATPWTAAGQIIKFTKPLEGVQTALKWRLHFSSGPGTIYAREIEFKETPGGADLATTLNVTGSDGGAVNAVDNNGGSYWGTGIPSWIQCTFTALREIRQFTYMPHNLGTDAPTYIRVQFWSDEWQDWISYWETPTAGNMVGNTANVFTMPA